MTVTGPSCNETAVEPPSDVKSTAETASSFDAVSLYINAATILFGPDPFCDQLGFTVESMVVVPLDSETTSANVSPPAVYPDPLTSV